MTRFPQQPPRGLRYVLRPMSSITRAIRRLRGAKTAGATSSSSENESQDWIDPYDLIATYSMQEMNEAADTYFKQWVDNPTPILRKPFTDLDETPELLSSFAQLVQGLHLSPGDVVLDFGSGACLSTRFLVQMGFEVIGLDVSAQALELGQQLFVDQPPIGDTIPPRFLVFDGYPIDLPPDSVDAIFCNDAFHHVPNPEV